MNEQLEKMDQEIDRLTAFVPGAIRRLAALRNKYQELTEADQELRARQMHKAFFAEVAAIDEREIDYQRRMAERGM